MTWLDWGDSTMREAEQSDVKIATETESATNILPSALLCVPLTTETSERQSALSVELQPYWPGLSCTVNLSLYD